MDWISFGVLVIAGTLGAWIGMRIFRRSKQRNQDSQEK